VPSRTFRGSPGPSAGDRGLSPWLRIAQPGSYPLNNQAALQLGYSTKNGENHLAGRRAGVELLGEGNELDALAPGTSLVLAADGSPIERIGRTSKPQWHRSGVGGPHVHGQMSC
jgi:hypothetical protein